MSSIKSSASSSATDYTNPTFRGALVSDHWSRDDFPELTTVPFSLIADISRASNAVQTIARIVRNSLCEPDASDAEPLGHSAHLGLLDAAELVGKYFAEISDRMSKAARDYASLDDAAEVCHD